MPKEVTHWILAHRIYEKMVECPLKNCLSENIHLYYIGSVALDTPYYLSGDHYSYFQALASRLHGINGENTYEPVYRIVQSYSREMPRSVYAFLCGVITHIMIDGAFHPLVYYLTGDYNSQDPARRTKAICSHRRLEANLDLYLSDSFFVQDSGWLSRALNTARVNRVELLDMLCMLYFGNAQACRRLVKKALVTHAQSMRRFTNRHLFILYKAANFLAHDRLASGLASFYPSTVDREFFKQNFDYYHSGWGRQIRESIEEIEQRAIRSSLEMFNEWNNMPAPSELAVTLKRKPGPSLETGV